MLLVFANKSDLPGALTATELAKGLALDKMSQRKWYAAMSIECL